jgi:hypothetical protein
MIATLATSQNWKRKGKKKKKKEKQQHGASSFWLYL